MVFVRSENEENEENSLKATPPANLSPTAGVELPTFKWGARRRLRCQLPSSNPSFSQNNKNNDEVPAEAAAAAAAGGGEAAATAMSGHKKVTSFNPPLPLEIRGEGRDEKRNRKKEKMVEFRVSLTKQEIDEDFLAMTGAKAPRRPQRRDKALQTEIECLYPGFLLPMKIAPDRYKVPDRRMP